MVTNRMSDYLPTQEPVSSGVPGLAGFSTSGAQVFQAVRSFVTQRPVASLAGALTAGMVIAWFIKRTR